MNNKAFFLYSLYETEVNITRQILKDLIKHIFAIKIDNGLIPLRLSKIQQQIYDAIF